MKRKLFSLLLLFLTFCATAQDNWAFDVYFKMETTITSDRNRDNAKMSQRLDYNENTNNVSISNQIIQTRGRSGNDNKNIDRIILDQQSGQIFTFMNMGDKKVLMKMPMNLMGMANSKYDGGDERYRLTSFVATGQTRTIGGQATDEYKGTSSGGIEVLVYISQRRYPNKNMAGLHKAVYKDYGRKRNSNSIPMMAAMEHDQVKNKLKDGYMVLGYKWKDLSHNKTVETLILEFDRQSSRFDGSQYESLL